MRNNLLLIISLLLAYNSSKAEIHADSVVSYTQGSHVMAPYNDQLNSLGPPNPDSGGVYYTSLGNGGELVVKFKKPFRSSGDTQSDLIIYEIGHDGEDCYVYVRTSETAYWEPAGGIRISGSSSHIDLDQYSLSDDYIQVKIVDVYDDDFDTADWAGADIDSVEALIAVVEPDVTLSFPVVQPSSAPCLIQVYGEINVTNYSGKKLEHLELHTFIGDEHLTLWSNRQKYFLFDLDEGEVRKVKLIINIPMIEVGNYNIRFEIHYNWLGNQITLDKVDAPFSVSKCSQLNAAITNLLMSIILNEKE